MGDAVRELGYLCFSNESWMSTTHSARETFPQERIQPRKSLTPGLGDKSSGELNSFNGSSLRHSFLLWGQAVPCSLVLDDSIARTVDGCPVAVSRSIPLLQALANHHFGHFVVCLLSWAVVTEFPLVSFLSGVLPPTVPLGAELLRKHPLIWYRERGAPKLGCSPIRDSLALVRWVRNDSPSLRLSSTTALSKKGKSFVLQKREPPSEGTFNLM